MLCALKMTFYPISGTTNYLLELRYIVVVLEYFMVSLLSVKMLIICTAIDRFILHRRIMSH